MCIIEKNKEIIKRCLDCSEKYKEISKNIDTRLNDLFDDPLNINRLDEVTKTITESFDKIRYEYETEFQTYMLFNGTFLTAHFPEKQRIDLFLASTIIMPEDGILLRKIFDNHARINKENKVNLSSSDIVQLWNNRQLNQETLSKDGLINLKWQNIYVLFNQWAIMRAYVERLKKVVEYVNCIIIDVSHANTMV